MTDRPTKEGDEALNLYGDDVVRTTGQHGADVSSQRLNDLDRAALRHALNTLDQPLSAVDIGCGLGAQGIRFGLLGIETTLVDILNISSRIEIVESAFEICDLNFVNADAKSLDRDDLPERIGTAYSQRFIHYLEFDDAVELLRTTIERMDEAGRLFISASGLHTELGDGYPHSDRPLEDRFAKLHPVMREKHDIRDQICLYTVRDMRVLFGASGIRPVEIKQSKFGNVKAIGEPE
jgi:hypothetical protein